MEEVIEILLETDISKLLTAKKSMMDRFYPLITSYNIGNVKLSCYDDNHAIARFNERFPKLGILDYKKVLKNGIVEINKRYSLKRGFYWIISKSTGVVIPLKIYVDEENITSSLIGAIDTTYISTFKRNSYKIKTKTFTIDDSEMKDIKVEEKESHNIIESMTNSDSISQWTEYEEDGCISLVHYFEDGEHETNGVVIEI